MKLKVIDCDFSVCKIRDISKVNFSDEFCFLSKTDEEISLVCKSEYVPNNVTDREDNWRAFELRAFWIFLLLVYCQRFLLFWRKIKYVFL